MSSSISQFYILSTRGDTIIYSDFRGDVSSTSSEVFFRKVKFWDKGDAPPTFHVDGVNYLYVKKNGLYFVATTRYNVSPSYVLELLTRLNNTVAIVAVDDEDDTLGVLEVMPPQRTDLVLTADIPHGELNVLVLDGLDVETCRSKNQRIVLVVLMLHIATYRWWGWW